jgi:hypothetical protein
MKLLKILRDEKFVAYKIETQGHQALEDRSIRCHEAPLESFDTALQALGHVASKILELRNDSGVIVESLSIRRTKHGTRSAVITITKHLKATDKPHRQKTPVFQFDDPTEGEGSRECDAEQAQLINTMVMEAEKYIGGERQQMLLGTVTAEPENGSAESDSDLLSQPANV